MSTKIYTGFHFPGLTSDGAISLLAAQQDAIQALVRQKNLKILAEQVALVVDKACLKSTKSDEQNNAIEDGEDAEVSPSNSAYVHCAMVLADRQTTCRGGVRRDPTIDCDVRLVFYLTGPDKGLIGYVQEEAVGVYEHLLTVKGVQDFSYWNNVDPPEDIPAQEWEARCSAWRQADGQKFSLCMEFQPEWTLPEELAGYFQSKETRAAKHAKNVLVNRALTAAYALRTEEEKSKASMSWVMRVVRTCEESLKDASSAEYVEWVKVRDDMLPKLSDDLPRLMLRPISELLS